MALSSLFLEILLSKFSASFRTHAASIFSTFCAWRQPEYLDIAHGIYEVDRSFNGYPIIVLTWATYRIVASVSFVNEVHDIRRIVGDTTPEESPFLIIDAFLRSIWW